MQVQEFLASRGQTALARRIRGAEAAFAPQLEGIDWESIARVKAGLQPVARGKIAPISGMPPAEISARRAEFEAIGLSAIRRGEVAAVLLAGGQGTRLGADAPKGTFDLGLTRPRPIFALLLENLLEIVKRAGAYVPLFIMTSELNDAATRAFFAAHGNFGYPASHLRFFPQEMAPAVDLNGDLLLADDRHLVRSPNGNGGWFTSLQRAGLEGEFPAVRWYNVFGVDNVLARIADPVFLGATVASGCKCGAKAVEKHDPAERVGVLCLEDGLPSVVEYYELDPALAALRGEDGRLAYRYGLTLNYLFERERLLQAAGERIPVHIVKKKIPYLSETGFVVPQEENGYKFETLILDLVRLMGSCLPFEVAREHEFAPVKNRTGVDSVETAREALQRNGVVL